MTARLGETTLRGVTVNAEDLYLDLLEQRAEHPDLPNDQATRQLLLIGDFVTSVEIEGLSAWLKSVSESTRPVSRWTELIETVEALSRIGALQSSQVLLSLIPQLEEHSGYDSWKEVLEQQGLDRFEDELDDIERIWALAESLSLPMGTE